MITIDIAKRKEKLVIKNEEEKVLIKTIDVNRDGNTLKVYQIYICITNFTTYKFILKYPDGKEEKYDPDKYTIAKILEIILLQEGEIEDEIS